MSGSSDREKPKGQDPAGVHQEDREEHVRPVVFKVHGRPVPLPRPRVFKGRAVSITSTKARAWKGAVRAEAEQAAAASGWIPSHRPLRLSLVFVYKRPKKHFDSKGLVLERYAHAYMTARPDIDNLAKMIMDAVNDVLYVDDSQVIYLTATKQYGAEDGVHVTLQEIDLTSLPVA